MTNAHYAQILREITQLLEIAGENPYRIRAFENATRIIENLNQSVDDLLAQEQLTSIKGIGKSIASDLLEVQQTGSCALRDALLEQLDPGILQLLRIQGLGPKRVKTLFHELHITNLNALEHAARSQAVQKLPGFGKKTEQKILTEIERLSHDTGRVPLPAALLTAEHLCSQLSTLEDVTRIEIAGSLRRAAETIGDIDILVASKTPEKVMDFFIEIAGPSEVLARGDTKTSIRLHTGMQVDLRVVDEDVFGSALHYFTGSKAHHIALRTRAKKAGLKISEYGVFRAGEEHPIASREEADVFQALGLCYIPPEIREDQGEIEAAEKNQIPRLIELSDIRGDLHMHTTQTDGQNSIEDMAQAAIERRYNYICITDHSEAVRVANGMTPQRFRQHIQALREVDKAMGNFRVLSGIEVDILKDGALDMDHELLAECDWVVGSIHSYFALDEAEMTKRLIRAMQTGLISCLGHPTGRILGGRPGYRYNFDAVFEAAVEYGVAMEINGSTGRLDLNAELAHRAHLQGVRIVLGSDAHSTHGLEDMRFALMQARRAWLRKEDVLNTYDVDSLLAAVRPSLR